MQLILYPTVIDHKNITEEIEFFVSEDGSRTALSQRSCAKLVGYKSPSGLWGDNCLGKLISNPDVDKALIPLELQEHIGKVYLDLPSGISGKANLVSSEFVADLANYLAKQPGFNGRETAEFTNKQFRRRGAHGWIIEVTNFSAEEKTHKLLEQMLSSMVKMEERMGRMEVKVEKWDKLGTYTSVSAPGLGDLVDSYSNDKNLLPSATKPVTAKEWLSAKGITLDSYHFRRFVLMAAQEYEALRRKKPRLKFAIPPGGTVSRKQGYAYVSSDFPILENCLTRITSK